MPKIIIVSLVLIFLFVIIVVINLINYTVYKTKPFNREIFSNYIPTWTSDEIFNEKDFVKSSASITVKLIHSGDLEVPMSKTINLKHPLCAKMENKEITVPIFAYLIHHEKYGYFLIDSGCESSYVDNSFGPMKGIVLPLVMSKTLLKPDNAIHKEFTDICNDIKGVFFTHLHFDHTSGLPDLPNNLLYIAGKGEKSLSIKWILEPNHFKKNDIIYMFDFDSKDSQNLSIGKAIDIFGDQTLWAISTPGHSKGHVSYLVNAKDHPILIAGDACIMNQSMVIDVGPGTSSENIELAQKTLDNIYNFVKKNPKVKVWAGHDYPQKVVEELED